MVRLTGEAYFDVVEEDAPFVVETFNAEVRVLGTRFNVRAWPEGMARHTFTGSDVGVSRPSSARDLVFETADGWITAGAVSNAEWLGLTRALGHPEWQEDDRFRTPAGRVKHADARLELTASVLATDLDATFSQLQA